VTVGVIVDSGAALPEDQVGAAQLEVVDLLLSIGGRDVAASTVEAGDLFGRDAGTVTTSAPPPGAFTEAVGRVQDGDGVVVLTLPETLSSTYASAVLGAREAGGAVRVVDTGTAAGAEALVALAAAAAARDGAVLHEVVAAAEAAARQVRLVGALGSLDHLVRGGHVPAAAGWAARRMGVVPIIELARGRVRPLRPALGPTSAVARVRSLWRHSRPEGPAESQVVAMHASDPSGAVDLMQRVVADSEPATAFCSGFGATLLAHTGPDMTGLAWRWIPVSDSFARAS
jgi:DegV family protein with EDD domain